MANVKINQLPLATTPLTGTEVFPLVQGTTTKQVSVANLFTDPVMVNPTLGTVGQADLINATGLPISTGVSGLGSGIATFLGTPSSANLRAAVTDETGTGALVFATSPTLVTPDLGTPTAMVATNITGTALGLIAGSAVTNANLTGAVTSIGNATSLGSFTSAQLRTALTDETGSGVAVFATSPTLVTPDLGTPSAGVLTNATGLPLTTGVTGTLGLGNGGTGQTTANAAFNALAPSQTGNSGKYLTTDGTNTSWGTNPLGTVTSVDVSGGTTGLTTSGGPVTTSGTITIGGTLATTNGGTGLTSFTANGVLYASSTSALTSGSALTFDGSNLFTVVPATGTAYNRTESAQYSTWLQTGAGNANVFWEFSAGTPVRWVDTSAGELMRLTSTGLGIGTSSPAYKLEASSSTNNYIGVTCTTDGNAASRFKNTQRDWLVGALGGASGAFGIYDITASAQRLTLDSSGNVGIGTSSPSAKLQSEVSGSTAQLKLTQTSYASYNFKVNTDSSLTIDKDGTTRLTVDSAGNLGLGVTPSAWDASGKGLQVGNQLALSWTSATGSFVGGNAYYGSGWKRIGTNAATAYLLGGDGTHIWYSTSTSGSADSAISFTQAMTLDASGRLMVGTTSSGSGGAAKFTVTGNAVVFNPNTDGKDTHTFTTDAVDDGTYSIKSNTVIKVKLHSNGDSYFTGGNVGIGTSSPFAFAKLTVAGTAGAQTGANQQVVISAPTTTAGQGAGIRFNAASGAKEAVGVIGLVNEASGASGAMTFHVYNAGADIPEYMRLDSAGNLGLGVTPSAWASGVFPSVLQLKYGAFAGTGDGNFRMFTNAVYDGAYKYLADGYASRIDLSSGGFAVFTAPSSTAGSALSYTQALTLDASGNLLVGTTSLGTSYGAGSGVIKQTGGVWTDRGQFSATGGSTTTITTLANASNNQTYLLSVRQSGSAGNYVMSFVTAYGASSSATRMVQDNTGGGVLDMNITVSGLGLRLVLGSGFGNTTWDWVLTRLG